MAQDISISGRIIDTVTGQALEKTNIYFGHEQGITSNEKGEYQYSAPKGQEIKLAYSFAGYETVHVTFVSQNDTIINVMLDPVTYDLNTVIVTGVQRERVLQNSPVPIQVISKEEIQTMGYTEVTDVLARTIPGISLQNDNMGTAITIDGLSARYVLILIDGKRIAGDTDGNMDFSRLNTLNIDRIEVIKGSGSLLYGSNAISGVVNIITKEAKEDGFDVSLNSRYSTYNTYNVGTVISAKKGKWNSTTDAQFKHTDGYYKANLISQNPYDDININQKLSYVFNKDLKVFGTIGYYNHERFDEGAARHPIYSDIRESIGVDYNINNKQNIKFEHAGDRYTTTQEVTISGNKIKEYENTVFTNRAVYTNEISTNNVFQAGFEYLNDDLYATNITDSSKVQSTASLFASDEINFSDQLSAVASSRYVYNTDFGSAFVPGISMMYKLNNINIRASYAMGYRSPSLKELYMDFDHLGWFTMVGNPDLKAETSHYTTISSEYYNSRFTASISLYHNLVNNKILETSPFDSNIVSYYNVDQARIIGSNIRFKATVLRLLKVTGGVSLQDPINKTTGEQLESTYKISGNLRIDFSHPLSSGSIGCSLMGSAYGTTTLWDLDNDGAVIYTDCPAFQMYDTTLNYSHNKGFSLIGGITNIFNYTDYDKKSTYSPGRTFFISMAYHFNK